MVDFPYRIDSSSRRSDTSSRKSIRELDNVRAEGIAPDDLPPVVLPVYGQGAATDPTLSGENIDHLITHFIARLKTPGNQISPPALKRLVETVTEMVSAFSDNALQQKPATPQQSWVSSYGAKENPDFTPQVSPTVAWGGDELYAQAGIPILTAHAGEAEIFPAFGQEAAFNGFSNASNAIYYPAAESGYAAQYPVDAELSEGLGFTMEEDKPSPVKAVFVPRGIPLSFLKDEDDVPPPPTLYDFIQELSSAGSEGQLGL